MTATNEQVTAGPATANEYLLAEGHNNGGRCEKCWQEAGYRYAMGHGPYESKVSAYYEVMEESQEAARAAIARALHPEERTT